MALQVLLALIVTLTWAPSARAEVVDRIVAVVNEEIVTLSELDSATSALLSGLKEGEVARDLPGDPLKARDYVLDNLIERALMRQGAEKAGIKVSERAVTLAIKEVLKTNNITEDELRRTLLENGLTMDEYREQLREEILQTKFMQSEFRSGIAISRAEEEEFYMQNASEFTAPASYRLRLIYLALPKSGDKEVLKKKVDAVTGGLNEGTEFSELAAAYSDGPATDRGGDIGFIRSGEIDPVIEEAISALEVGEVAGPINIGENAEGVNFFQLVEMRPSGVMPFKDVRRNIKGFLYQQRMQENYDFWIADAIRSSYIEIRL